MQTLTDKKHEGAVRIDFAGDFSPEKTFDCGQCFRFEELPDKPGAYGGVAHGKYITVARDGDALVITGITPAEYESTFREYLGLDRDYAAIAADIASRSETLADAAEIGRGIRILHQDEWEAFCSFVISQNNNIPKIKRSVNLLCREYGERIECADGETRYAFPDPQTIAALDPAALAPLGVGYRAPYIVGAARAACDRFLSQVRETRDTGDALKLLMTVRGVGLKVASCTLLFGFARLDCFPVDVWMRRALERLQIPPDSDFGAYAGVAQQYIFYRERYILAKSAVDRKTQI